MAIAIYPQNSTFSATVTFGRCQTSTVDPIYLLIFSKVKYNCFSVSKQNLRAFSAGSRVQDDSRRNRNVAVHANAKPAGAPLPPNPSPGPCVQRSSSRKVWILGTIITILVSFSKGKWGPLLKFKEKIETATDEAEHVVEIVGEVAEEVEKVAEEAVKHLPMGKLHDAAEFVEKIGEEIAKDAQIAEDAIEKVEEMEKEVESFFESTSNQEHTVMTTEAIDQK